jgi:hypothetical protein
VFGVRFRTRRLLYLNPIAAKTVLLKTEIYTRPVGGGPAGRMKGQRELNVWPLQREKPESSVIQSMPARKQKTKHPAD